MRIRLGILIRKNKELKEEAESHILKNNVIKIFCYDTKKNDLINYVLPEKV